MSWTTRLAVPALALLSMGSVAKAGAESRQADDAMTKEPAHRQDDFIRPGAPRVPTPPFTGDRYERLVPDTIDIAERMKLAIQGLTGPLDAQDNYTLYWLVHYGTNPPVMKKESYCNLRAKFMEALPLLRLATGSRLHDHIDQIWIDNMVRQLGPDGLIYAATKSPSGQYFSLGGCGTGRLMGAMMIYWQRDRNPMWRDVLERMILRLGELAVDKGDYAYFSQGNFPLGALVDPDLPMPTGVWSVDGFNGRIVQELGQFYGLTGFVPAQQLGDKLVNYLLKKSEYFGAEGEWLRDQLDPAQYPGRQEDVHFGTHSHTLLYLLDYAVATHDAGLLTYVKKSFEWAVENNETLPGQSRMCTRVGFFAEYQNPYYPTSETCGVADMIAVALKLSDAGVGDYWDDADRWIRNQFVENQTLSSDWVADMHGEAWPRPTEPDESSDRVAERNVGTFFGWPSANDGCPRGDGHMHCCAGNGSRTLYYIWENMLREKDGQLQLNLLMNRASKWADVDSFIPYTGRVDLAVKEALQMLSIRAPQWIAGGSEDIQCVVDGETRPLRWSGRYVKAGSVHAGQVVSVTFPIRTEKVSRRIYGRPVETLIGGVVYDSITFKGNEVVDIKPEGKHYPLYQRDRYLSDEPRWRKVERFISTETIRW